MSVSISRCPRRSRLIQAAALALAFGGLCLESAGAQGAGALEWERVGTIQNVRALAFDADTLYACASFATASPFTTGVLRPGDPDFTQAFRPTTEVGDLLFERDGVIYALGPTGSGIARTANRGTMWTEHVATKHAFTLPLRTPAGALVAGVRGNPDGLGSLAARSTDDGLTWALHGIAGTQGMGTTSLVALPAAADRPLGRLVAAGYGGLATSDDDGLTWMPTALYGPFVHNAWSTATVAAGLHAGRILAVIESVEVQNGIYASADGRTWTRLAALPTASPFESRLVASPDGAVYLYDIRGYTPPHYAEGQPVWRSLDGGATWTDVGRVWTAWSVIPSQIEVGPDGRLYVSARGETMWRTDPPERGGVFRTVERVVGAAPAPPAVSPLTVSVRPNPSDGGLVAVSVTLSAPSSVRVSVVDALGRTVAVLHDGASPDGDLALPLDTSRLAPGVYVVRALAGDDSSTARLVVSR